MARCECPNCGGFSYTSQGWPEPEVNTVECNDCAHEFEIVHTETGYHVAEDQQGEATEPSEATEG